MQKIAVEKSRLHIPLIFGLDIIHGYRTEFPVPLALSATWDPALVERASRVAAKESSHEGVRWTYSPMVDIARDARWGRIIEGAGEDPYLGSAMAAAYVRGYQGSKLGDPESIAACTKHFVGYGAAEGGRDYNTTEIPVRLLRQVYLPPFQATVDAGVATFMSAFNSLNEVPASANAFHPNAGATQGMGLQGFRGERLELDWRTDSAGHRQHWRRCCRQGDSGRCRYGHGSRPVRQESSALVKSGVVPESVIDEAVRRILRVKFALGLFDHPYTDARRGRGSPRKTWNWRARRRKSRSCC